MTEINWALVAPLIVIQVVLLIVALIDLKRANSANGPKWIWAMVVICFSIIGPIVYFIFGRKSA